MSPGSPSPAASAATTRPRTQRFVSSKRSDPPRRGVAHGATAARPAEAHQRATGHASQRGARAVQTVAPSSIAAWFQSAARPGGKSAAGGP
jgi:hypothetical protein